VGNHLASWFAVVMAGLSAIGMTFFILACPSER
jgi:hypothetical protein